MSNQIVGIVGSFAAGVPTAQREVTQDRDRAEAYRSLMREQVKKADRPSEDDVTSVTASERVIIEDDAHERRNPYMSVRRPKRVAKSEESQGDELDSDDPGPGGQLDVVL